MGKRHFIIIFFFLFVVSAAVIFANNQSWTEAASNMNQDKIKTVAQNIVKEASKKAEESALVAVEKIKEVTGSAYEIAKDKGGEMVSSLIIEPSSEVVKSVVKKAISVVSPILTEEEIKEVLSNGGNSCSCD